MDNIVKAQAGTRLVIKAKFEEGDFIFTYTTHFASMEEFEKYAATKSGKLISFEILK